MGEIVLTFDPMKGSGGMKDASECYSHIGLITENSKNTQDWKYVVVDGEWGKKTEPQWTKVGDNWQLVIDNMYTFFGCPESEKIMALVMVFHDGNGSNSKEGKSSTGGDILVGVGEELSADIWEFFEPDDVEEEARPNGVVNGIYYGSDGTSVTLCTYAASKTEPAKHVFLVGDMTNWKLNNDFQLKRDGNYFWIELKGLESGKEYRFQYAIERADGVKKQISDLFSEKVIHPDDNYEPRSIDPTLIDYPLYGADGYVTVIQPGKKDYEWSDATLNFKRPDKNNLVIYEMWVYDHTPMRNFEGLMERLDYLQNLGVNAIDLMPVNEFDGNYSWGYNPNHYFALDKAYGTPEQFKTFVDECHKRGMAVILDMVFNHATGNNPMNKLYPYTSYDATKTELRLNPWFNVNAPHPDNVSEDWNHGFEPVRDHFIRVLKYWLTEYKVDGYRMEMSHGLCSDQPQTSVANLKYYYKNGVQAVSSDAYFILEHWGQYIASERPQLVAEGMMCWENTANAFQQTAMGWLKDGDDFAGANKDGYVTYSDNLYEERCFFKAKQWGDGDLKTNEEARDARIPLVLGFQSMLNGPQMFYHFAEIGFDYSKYQKADGTWGQDGYDAYGQLLVPQYANEQAEQMKKARPEELGWFQEGYRMNGYQRLAQIIQLRTRLIPSVFEGNPTATSFASGNPLRFIQWGSDVFVIGNFSATEERMLNLPSGTWYDYLDGNEKAGSSYTFKPGEIKVFTGKQIPTPDVPDHYSFIGEPQTETITVAQTLEIGQNLAVKESTEADYVVTGYVVGLETEYNSQYGNQNYWIADTQSGEATGALYVYRGACDKAVKKGYKVSISSKILRYGETIIETTEKAPVTILEETETNEPLILYGKCGAEGDSTNLSWQLNLSTWTLDVQGSGAMADSVQYLPWHSQNYWKYITSVNLPDGLTTIGLSAFDYCRNLTSIVIPETVELIGKRAFTNCEALTSLNIPESVHAFGGYAFVGIGVKQPLRNTRFFCYMPRTFAGKYTIPEGTTNIISYAFEDCINLTEIIIPSSAKDLGYYAFGSCSALQSITCLAVNPPACRENMSFANVDKSIPVYVPAESIEAYKEAEEWKDFTNILPIQAAESDATDISAEPTETDVIITWPAITDATIYTIQIWKGEELICTLSFNEQGQLLSISFEKKSGKDNPRNATQTATGWQYTISGLDPGTNYTYKLVAMNGETELFRDEKQFTTTMPTAIDEIVNGKCLNGKYLIDGHLYILRDGKIYTPHGARVE